MPLVIRHLRSKPANLLPAVSVLAVTLIFACQVVSLGRMALLVKPSKYISVRSLLEVVCRKTNLEDCASLLVAKAPSDIFILLN